MQIRILPDIFGGFMSDVKIQVISPTFDVSPPVVLYKRSESHHQGPKPREKATFYHSWVPSPVHQWAFLSLSVQMFVD